MNLKRRPLKTLSEAKPFHVPAGKVPKHMMMGFMMGAFGGKPGKPKPKPDPGIAIAAEWKKLGVKSPKTVNVAFDLIAAAISDGNQKKAHAIHDLYLRSAKTGRSELARENRLLKLGLRTKGGRGAHTRQGKDRFTTIWKIPPTYSVAE